jgi:hypothetical protein
MSVGYFPNAHASQVPSGIAHVHSAVHCRAAQSPSVDAWARPLVCDDVPQPLSHADTTPLYDPQASQHDKMGAQSGSLVHAGYWLLSVQVVDMHVVHATVIPPPSFGTLDSIGADASVGTLESVCDCAASIADASGGELVEDVVALLLDEQPLLHSAVATRRLRQAPTKGRRKEG